MNQLSILSRTKSLFLKDLEKNSDSIKKIVGNSSFLVVGGAGSIGQAVSEQLFALNAKVLHVVDISENNLVELVRKIRSTTGYNSGEFRTFAIDVGSYEFLSFFEANGPYDFVLNLSALKHVRSEKDPYTLARLVKVNIFNSVSLAKLCGKNPNSKYFCVSTDKAANPVNMMGASKRIMELFLARQSSSQSISSARFANVAFSDGSLLHGFNQRFLNQQPISAPSDVLRYFVTKEESGQLCLMSCLFGGNMDIYFPKIDGNLSETSFSSIAQKYVTSKGFDPVICETEEEARRNASTLIQSGKWPCYFFSSDTTGEKDLEEFYTQSENVDFSTFFDIGVVKYSGIYSEDKLLEFERSFNRWVSSSRLDKAGLIEIFNNCIQEFKHSEKNKSLDERM